MIKDGNTNLNTTQVAKMVGLSACRLREIARAGDIRCYRPAGRRRIIFKAKDVAAYLGCKLEDL